MLSPGAPNPSTKNGSPTGLPLSEEIIQEENPSA